MRKLLRALADESKFALSTCRPCSRQCPIANDESLLHLLRYSAITARSLLLKRVSIRGGGPVKINRQKTTDCTRSTVILEDGTATAGWRPSLASTTAVITLHNVRLVKRVDGSLWLLQVALQHLCASCLLIRRVSRVSRDSSCGNYRRLLQKTTWLSWAEYVEDICAVLCRRCV